MKWSTVINYTDQDTQLFAVIRCGDGYESDDIIGYADNQESAQYMLEQAKILNTYYKYRIEPIKIINFLFKNP